MSIVNILWILAQFEIKEGKCACSVIYFLIQNPPPPFL